MIRRAIAGRRAAAGLDHPDRRDARASGEPVDSSAATTVRAMAMLRAAARSDLVVPGFAIAALVVAELTLSRALYGTNFGGGDGKMAQAIILAAQKFGGFFQFNNINPLQGLGSQLLPMNVWLNPVYWPFAAFI